MTDLEILNYIRLNYKDEGTVSATELQNSIKMDTRVISMSLNRLVHKGLIKRHSFNGSIRYWVTEKVYQKRISDKIYKDLIMDLEDLLSSFEVILDSYNIDNIGNIPESRRFLYKSWLLLKQSNQQ